MIRLESLPELACLTYVESLPAPDNYFRWRAPSLAIRQLHIGVDSYGEPCYFTLSYIREDEVLLWLNARVEAGIKAALGNPLRYSETDIEKLSNLVGRALDGTDLDFT